MAAEDIYIYIYMCMDICINVYGHVSFKECTSVLPTYVGLGPFLGPSPLLGSSLGPLSGPSLALVDPSPEPLLRQTLGLEEASSFF